MDDLKIKNMMNVIVLSRLLSVYEDRTKEAVVLFGSVRIAINAGADTRLLVRSIDQYLARTAAALGKELENGKALKT